MISLVACTNRPEMITNIFNNYERQVYKGKELIIIINRDDTDLNYWQKKAKKYPKVSVYHLPHQSLGNCLNFGFARAQHDYITKFDDDDYYAPYYLTEIMNAFKKTEVDIVGKSKFYSYIEKYKSLAISKNGYENKFVNWIAGPTISVKKKVFKRVRWGDITGGEDKLFQTDCVEKGFKLYSTSKYNFAYIRRKPEEHTWGISDEGLLEWFNIICQTEDYKKMILKGYAHAGDL